MASSTQSVQAKAPVSMSQAKVGSKNTPAAQQTSATASRFRAAVGKVQNDSKQGASAASNQSGATKSQSSAQAAPLGTAPSQGQGTPPNSGPWAAISPQQAATAKQHAADLANDQKAVQQAPEGSDQKIDAELRSLTDVTQTKADAADVFDGVGRTPGQTEFFPSIGKFDSTRVGLNAIAGTSFEPEGYFSRAVADAENQTAGSGSDVSQLGSKRVTQEQFANVLGQIVAKGSNGGQLRDLMSADLIDEIKESKAQPQEITSAADNLKARLDAGQSTEYQQAANSIVDNGVKQVLHPA